MFHFSNHRAATGVSVGCMVLGATFAGALATAAHPAVADALAAIQSVVTCATSAACISGKNTAAGPGVAASSARGIGVSGTSGNHYGVYGTVTGTSGIGVAGQVKGSATGTSGGSVSGPGVYGVSASADGVQGVSTTGNGVQGSSGDKFGVYGSTTSGSGIGVVGQLSGSGTGTFGGSTSGFGITGISGSGIGTYGASTSNDGLEGVSSSGVGVYGSSTSSNGMSAVSQTGTGLFAQSSSNSSNPQPAIAAQANAGGDGIDAYTSTGSGLAAYSTSGNGAVYGEDDTSGGGGVGVYGNTTSGTGVLANASGNGFALDAEGNTSYAILAQSYGLSPTITAVNHYLYGFGGFAANLEGYSALQLQDTNPYGFEIAAYDYKGNITFAVFDNGSINYAGSLSHSSDTSIGSRVTAFNADTTVPTVEDTGTAQLVGGIATVRLDPLFAAAIEPTTYRVFVTPEGETHGWLYVATKTPAGFVVREALGGRSSASFDYRIVATKFGHTRERMALAAPPARVHASSLPAHRSSRRSARPKAPAALSVLRPLTVRAVLARP